MLVDAGHAISWASGWWEAYEPIMDLLTGRTKLPTGGRWGSDGG